MKILTAEQMREVDRLTIEEAFPGLILWRTPPIAWWKLWSASTRRCRTASRGLLRQRQQWRRRSRHRPSAAFQARGVAPCTARGANRKIFRATPRRILNCCRAAGDACAVFDVNREMRRATDRGRRAARHRPSRPGSREISRVDPIDQRRFSAGEDRRGGYSVRHAGSRRPHRHFHRAEAGTDLRETLWKADGRLDRHASGVDSIRSWKFQNPGTSRRLFAPRDPEVTRVYMGTSW